MENNEKTTTEAITETTAESPDKKRAKKPRPLVTWLLHLLQPACLTVGLVTLAYLLMNSVIFLETEYNHTRGDSLWDEVNNTSFEDSALFRELLEERVRSVIEVGAARSKMEKNGSYDVNEAIDINAAAYRNTNTHYPERVVKYRLGDLIQWAEQGFVSSEV
jgi:hypothetical protein